MNFDYIFIVGAPGSKWSSVSASIYQSKSIDQSDSSMTREYIHESVHHFGSYFDPGMEFGNFFNEINLHDIQKSEREFNLPFSINNKHKRRIIKSHCLSNHIEFLKNTWQCNIIIVYRNNDECMQWWLDAGGFNITYPDYSWYDNNEFMYENICLQNQSILDYMKKYSLHWNVSSNHELCDFLFINKSIPYRLFETNVCVI